MKISNAEFEVSGQELQDLLVRKSSEVENLSDIHLSLDDNMITVSCKYKVPIIGSIDGTVQLRPEIADVDTLHLYFDLVGVGGMVHGFIMKFLDSKISELSFLSRQENVLKIVIPELLKFYEIEGNIEFMKLAVADNIISLEISGEGSLVQFI
jgi:hypothetical protein